MSRTTFSDILPSGTISSVHSSSHEAVLLLKLSLNDNGFANYAPLPDNVLRNIVPLDSNILYPKSVSAYVTCCSVHANSLMTRFLDHFPGISNPPAPGHRPAVLLHSAHVRRHPELESNSNARRFATIWTSKNNLIQFAFNDAICSCCSEHAELLSLDLRDTFSVSKDESNEMNLTSMPTVSRTSTPELSMHSESHHAPIPSSASVKSPSASYEPRPSATSQTESLVPPPPLTTSHEPVSSSQVITIRPHSPTGPRLSTDPLNYQASAGYVDWSADDPRTGPSPLPSRSQVESHYNRPLTLAPYASAANRAPTPVISSQVSDPRRRHPIPPPSPLPSMSEPLPAYVTDPDREIFKLNFNQIVTVLRCEMLLCLHVLDYPYPSHDAIIAARHLLVANLLNQNELRTTLGNYSFAPNLFVEHLQDYHVNAIRSSSTDIEQSITYDEHNCKILRCIFFYRQGTHVDATAYLNSFNPLNAYHMLLARLNENRYDTTPRMKVSIVNSHPTAKCYILPSSDFDVHLNNRDPASLSEIPAPSRTFYSSSPSSSRGSTRQPVRRTTNPSRT